MTETNFENEENILLNKKFDPDENFFDKNNFSKVNAQYYSLDELQENRITRGNNSLDELQENLITITYRFQFYMSIFAVYKNFDNFKLMLSDLNYEFSMICLSETWCSNDSFQNNSNYNLSQYNSIHQERKNKGDGGVCS